MWRRGKQSRRKKENHFQVEEIKRVVQKIMDSKEEEGEKWNIEENFQKLYKSSNQERKGK